IVVIICYSLNSTFFPYTTLFRSELTFKALVDPDAGLASSQPGIREQYQKFSCGKNTRSTFMRGCRAGCSRRDARLAGGWQWRHRSEEHTSELQSRFDLVCRLLLE